MNIYEMLMDKPQPYNILLLLGNKDNNQQKDWEENKLEEKFIHLTRPLSLVIENMEPSHHVILLS